MAKSIMYQLQVGQIVDVKEYGRAEVLSLSSPEHPGRVQVRYLDDGSTYWCRQNVVRPVHPTEKRLVACPETHQYRLAVIHNASHGDVVLEVGCHEGVTTSMLHTRVKAVVGVDLSVQPVTDARARFPNCRFEVCDGFDIQKLKSFSPKSDGSYDKIFVDVGPYRNNKVLFFLAGGIAPLSLVFPLVTTLMDAFKKAVLIVKSVHLSRFLGQSEVLPYDRHMNWVLPSPSSAAVKSTTAQGVRPSSQAGDNGKATKGAKEPEQSFTPEAGPDGMTAINTVCTEVCQMTLEEKGMQEEECKAGQR